MGPNCLGTVGSKGGRGQMPVIREKALISKGERERGGTKTVGIPEYVLAVTNVPEPVPPVPPTPPAPPGDKPAKANSPNPASGATNLFPGLLTTLSWTGGEDTTSFIIWFNGVFQTATTGNSFTLPPLAVSTQYTWRIDSLNEVGITIGDTWVFTTGNEAVPVAPLKPVNPSPANGAPSVDQAHAVVLSWSNGGGTLSYDVYFNGVFQVNQASTSFSVGVLSPLTAYTWRIDAVNHDGTTRGDTWTFTTDSGLPPAPNQAITPSPAIGATGVNPTGLVLTWANGGGATSYDVWFNGVFKGNQAGTSYTPTVTYSTPYTWRIDAKNLGGTTTGVTWSFTTQAPPLHPLVIDWVNRVVAHGGASPSAGTQSAMSTFCNGLDSAGLTSLMLAVNCFVPDSLTAALTPLIKTVGTDPWTNGGPYVAADVNPNGIKGNASSKYLNTGVLGTAFSSTSSGITLYFSELSAVAQYDSGYTSNSTALACSLDAGNPFTGGSLFASWNFSGGSGGVGAAFLVNPGYLSGSRTAANAFALYFASSAHPHAALATGNTTGGTPQAIPCYVGAINLYESGVPIGFSSNRYSFAAFHQGLTATQSAAFYNLIQALRTALGGGFI